MLGALLLNITLYIRELGISHSGYKVAFLGWAFVNRTKRSPEPAEKGGSWILGIA